MFFSLQAKRLLLATILFGFSLCSYAQANFVDWMPCCYRKTKAFVKKAKKQFESYDDTFGGLYDNATRDDIVTCAKMHCNVSSVVDHDGFVSAAQAVSQRLNNSATELGKMLKEFERLASQLLLDAFFGTTLKDFIARTKVMRKKLIRSSTAIESVLREEIKKNKEVKKVSDLVKNLTKIKKEVEEKLVQLDRAIDHAVGLAKVAGGAKVMYPVHIPTPQGGEPPAYAASGA